MKRGRWSSDLFVFTGGKPLSPKAITGTKASFRCATGRRVAARPGPIRAGFPAIIESASRRSFSLPYWPNQTFLYLDR
jgi:hypothetical protein